MIIGPVCDNTDASVYSAVIIEIFNSPKAAQTHIEYKSMFKKIHSELNVCSTGCWSVEVLFTKFASLCLYNTSMSWSNEIPNISNTIFIRYIKNYVHCSVYKII